MREGLGDLENAFPDFQGSLVFESQEEIDECLAMIDKGTPIVFTVI